MGRIVKVECHSGYIYAERPLAVTMDKQRLMITRIIRESKTQVGQAFEVQMENGRELELVYDENNDEWKLID